MKNKEKFIDKLADFACIRDNIAMNVKGELVGCYGLLCENCKFYTEKDCGTASREWLEEEYVEQMVISSKDVRLLECIKDSYTYVARDLSGDMFLYINRPEKGSRTWFSDMESLSIKRFDVCFPMVKWEDEGPWKIEDLKKFKVVENYEIS
uniref:Uncharacterized protein n=1 Tax=Siphoviridae sp. ctX5W26 TaxID=2825540 RepID=A0A8S5UEJ4_9CAUD|nr:MAG TPA: hypothetical protein [Siphoviridae sp. ctX5W26]